ncbi:signal recognition particle receptor beta subunit-domain-containing protein [Mycena maculata]|uniref:Signal recognition particle receptor subunit beta n=1 Tax=Mycena maculata TaxID=230809 RepID=A0AAD7N1J5_9AGAR|nr:signal recognition particle receptor beta subunit-domain-containing protein [Mycena maculata]
MEDDTDSSAPPVVPATPIFTSQTLIVASLSLAIACLAILVFFTRRKSKSSGNLLLLVGPPDGGKTAILSTLVYDQTLPTHTSLQTNSSAVALPALKKTLTVVDIPGHPRIRNQVNEYIGDSKAIAFVVDASTVSRNGPAVAEHLHIILNALTSLPPSQVLPSLLILAHKSDLLKSGAAALATSEILAVNRVKTILERELEKRRVSQSGGVGVEGLGEEGERTEMGGLECSGEKGTFQFNGWEGGEVVFLGTSVKVGKAIEDDEKGADGLSALRHWMEDNV